MSVEARFGIAQDEDTQGVPENYLERQEDQRVIRDLIVDVARAIEQSVSDSRERSLALTKLEEALLWAGKAIFAPNRG